MIGQNRVDLSIFCHDHGCVGHHIAQRMSRIDQRTQRGLAPLKRDVELHSSLVQLAALGKATQKENDQISHRRRKQQRHGRDIKINHAILNDHAVGLEGQPQSKHHSCVDKRNPEKTGAQPKVASGRTESKGYPDHQQGGKHLI